ncbi:MAG TPA: MAPEG family protein [Candidatus Limnocylindrales bacterium]|nr:MAPEG family protein [Candidatus Limnocylindrales bacterium]
MTGITALLLFAAWTLLLMSTFVGYRTAMVLGGRKADSWTRGQNYEVPGWVRRAEHAHMNCVENLPIVAAVVLSAYVLGKPGVADWAMPYVLAARVAQSAVHLAGVNHWLVQARAAFFTVQVALVVYMIVALI